MSAVSVRCRCGGCVGRCADDDDDDDGGGGGGVEARAISPVCSFLPLVSRDSLEEGSGEEAAPHTITDRGRSEQPHLQRNT